MKSWQVMTWAFTAPVERPAERLVLAAYEWRCNMKTMRAWPGIDQLCQDTKLYRETINEARRALVRFGYIEDTGERRNRAAVYRLLMREKPQDGASEEAAKAAVPPLDCGDCRSELREKPHGTPISDFELAHELVQRADAREPVQAGEALHPEQAQRTEGLEPAIDKVKREFPHLFSRS